MRHNYSVKSTKSASSNNDDLASCMNVGVVRKHRHSVKNPGSKAQAWDRASYMTDTCSRLGSKRASGAQSADWGTAR